MVHYFAYGSNMHKGDLDEWCRRKGYDPVTFVRKENAVLKDWQIVFNYYSLTRKGGVANIALSEGEEVWGLLLEVSEKDYRKILRKEGAPNYYEEVEVGVSTDRSNGAKRAKTFRVVKERERKEFQPPKQSYLNLLIESAERCSFPARYIEQLRKIPTSELARLMRKIENLSEEYTNDVELLSISSRISGGDKSQILQSWWISLIFFFDRVFYQGRRDQVSGMFEAATVKALNELLGETDEQKLDNLLTLRDRGCLDYRRKDTLCASVYSKLRRRYRIQRPDGTEKDSSTGKERDREMTVDALRFVAETLGNHDFNILQYAICKIRDQKMRELYDQLTCVRQVGDKTATLFLRDVVAVYGLEESVTQDDLVFLQPVDTWVRQLSGRINLAREGTSDKQLKRTIVEVCSKVAVSPIRFNQGLYYLGSHALELILRGYSLR